MSNEKQRLDSAESRRSCGEPCCPPPSRLYKGFVIASLVVMIVTVIINSSYSYLSTMFWNNGNDTRREQNSGFNPPGWAFSIWGFIYPWNIAFLIYSVVALFPQTRLHRAPFAVFPVYIVNNLCGTLWFVFSEQYIYWPGTLAITGLPVTLYICIALSVWSLHRHRCRFFLYTYLVNNALALYAGWTTVAYLLYLSQTLIYGHGTDKVETGTVLLSWLLFKLTVFCSLEVTLLDKHMRHIWAHYLALINAVGGSLINNFDATNPGSIISVAIAGVVGFAFVVKLLKIVLGRCERHDLIESRVVTPQTDIVSVESPEKK